MRLRTNQPASKRVLNKVAKARPTEKPIESAPARPGLKGQAGSRDADGLTAKQQAFVGH
jgi:hypothetical protein